MTSFEGFRELTLTRLLSLSSTFSVHFIFKFKGYILQFYINDEIFINLYLCVSIFHVSFLVERNKRTNMKNNKVK